MDWFSWLSRTGLDPSLIYEYGLAFARNELQKEDLSYFNHEFLQSMGISVAKHRLEILKLAKKEAADRRPGAAPMASFSKLVSALNTTRKSVAKRLNKFISHETLSTKCLPGPVPEPDPEPEPVLHHLHQHQLEKCKSATMSGKYKSSEIRVEKPVVRPRRAAKSGPLDRRVVRPEKLMLANGTKTSLKLSGPLDRERLVFAYRSPISSGPMDGRMTHPNRSPRLSGPLERRPRSPRVYADSTKEKFHDDHTLWAALFEDLKPT